MNKTELVVVFMCGLISALLLPSLKSSMETITDSISDVEFLQNPALRLFSADGHSVDLLEEGYLTKVKFERSYGKNTALSMREDTNIEQSGKNMLSFS